MIVNRYSVNQKSVNSLLVDIRSNEIAIPEIQRPFVWNAVKVRDLIDSLYQGYPIGYLIAWHNPSVRLKDGTRSKGKKILIDGQQRVTALMAALLGEYIVDKDYRRVKIIIAFHPKERKFEVTNPAIRKDKSWIPDISKILSPEIEVLEFVNKYCENNEGSDQNEIFKSIEPLLGIIHNQIGLIELNSDLDIETVTEIFIRINSQGAILSQADFAMSKIAANEIYGGNELRKCIDYFCHLAVFPEFYQQLADTDQEFAKTEYFQKMTWLKNESDDLYDPSYTDMLRVAFTSQFKRGRLADLVALLSGRNFVTRDYEESIAEESFNKLKEGLFNFMNETNFKNFIMILRSAGFIESSMIRSQNTINFAYILYIVLRAQRIAPAKIESYIRKWFVMSMLTRRYSSSPESSFDFDIKRINEIGIAKYIEDVEAAELSDAFWNAGLPQQMNTSVASSPYFNVYLASQVYKNDKGFLSRDITVQDLLAFKGDVHHLFPRNYLKKHGLTRNKYNQIANYVMMQSEINISIGDKSPADYFSKLLVCCHNGDEKAVYGAITNLNQIKDNFAMHCVPEGMENKTIEHYEEFLQERRKLMAKKIKKYYWEL
ncbi:MAG: DUF262 domain-containing protein [Bacteroidetes bacterium]|nr:DUF262 domain-containing protein [Bacteroidota bacterium]